MVRTVYGGPNAGEERYHYDGARLVAIDEFFPIHETVRGKAWRADVRNVGGRVEVGDGVLTLHGQVIWRASDEPFAARLARAVVPVVDDLLLSLHSGIDRLRPVDRVELGFTLGAVLVVTTAARYVDSGKVEGPHWADRCDDDEHTLLREAALDVEDPVAAIGEAVAAELATRDVRRYIKAPPDVAIVISPSS